MSQLAMVIKTKTQPGKRDEVRALYEEHLAPRAEANADQRLVVWCDDDQDPDAFVLMELYATREAFEANASAPWFGEYMAAAGPLLAAQPEIVMGTPRWSKGV